MKWSKNSSPDLATYAPALSLCLADYHLSHLRQYGPCWLAGDLWRQLGLDQFWAEKLPPSREGTDWAKLLQVSVAYRLIAPGSEWRCHRQWYDRSAMGDLLMNVFEAEDPVSRERGYLWPTQAIAGISIGTVTPENAL